MVKEYKSRPTIQSLDRGLKLLDYITSAGKPVELGELAEHIVIEKSSTHRLMATLIAGGFIIQDAQKRYLPGPAILKLASRISTREQVHDMAVPYLNKLISKTGETAHLAVLGKGRVILTNYATSNHALAVTGRIGESEPVYCTALGKALVCEMENISLKELFGNTRLKKYTDNTICSIGAFLKECARVKTEQFARDDEEYRLGIRCLAAPVKKFSGDIIAAIGISGPKSRLNDKQFNETAEIVKEIGIELSERLGYVFKEL